MSPNFWAAVQRAQKGVASRYASVLTGVGKGVLSEPRVSSAPRGGVSSVRPTPTPAGVPEGTCVTRAVGDPRGGRRASVSSHGGSRGSWASRRHPQTSPTGTWGLTGTHTLQVPCAWFLVPFAGSHGLDEAVAPERQLEKASRQEPRRTGV